MNCPICGKEFIKHNGMQKFCSLDCTRIAKNNKRNKYSRTELEKEKTRKCLVCDAEFTIHSRQYTKKYCSEDCSNKAERLFGDKRNVDLNYKNQIRFGGNQFKVLERDEYKCVMCGNTHQLIVHHKDFSGNSDNINNDMTNLVTLCRSCHVKIHKLNN